MRKGFYQSNTVNTKNRLGISKDRLAHRGTLSIAFHNGLYMKTIVYDVLFRYRRTNRTMIHNCPKSRFVMTRLADRHKTIVRM